MDSIQNNIMNKLKKTLDLVFSTDNGRDLLNLLKEHFTKGTSIGNTPEITYYNLGQKELVELLENLYNDDKFLEKIEIKH